MWGVCNLAFFILVSDVGDGFVCVIELSIFRAAFYAS